MLVANVELRCIPINVMDVRLRILTLRYCSVFHPLNEKKYNHR